MEIFYYTIQTTGKIWSECDQYEIEARDWFEFSKFIQALANSENKVVRASFSPGYDTEATYFQPSNNQ